MSQHSEYRASVDKEISKEEMREIEDDKLPDGWPSRMEMIDALYRALGLPLDATRTPQSLWLRGLEEVAALRLNDMLYPEARGKHEAPQRKTKTLFIRNPNGEAPTWDAAQESITTREREGYAVKHFHSSAAGVVIVFEVPDPRNQ